MASREWARRETAWSREAKELVAGGVSRRWMLERIVCAHRGLDLTGPDERALVWTLLEAWHDHEHPDQGDT